MENALGAMISSLERESGKMEPLAWSNDLNVIYDKCRSVFDNLEQCPMDLVDASLVWQVHCWFNE